MSVVQTQLPSSFKQHLAGSSDRAKAITNAIAVFISTDLQPYSVVENTGFKHILKVIEPQYEIPSRPHISQKVIPALYEQVKAAVVHDLSKASAVALTTDVWTSRGTESYLTVITSPLTGTW